MILGSNIVSGLKSDPRNVTRISLYVTLFNEHQSRLLGFSLIMLPTPKGHPGA